MFLQFKRFVDGHTVFVRASSITAFVPDDNGNVVLYNNDASIHVRCSVAQLIEALNLEMQIV